MFYSTYVLTKKGPLAKLWLAAHWDKKLSKQSVSETSIQESVDALINPQAPIALRTSGHLLLGVVRIFSRKVKYLLTDCNDAVGKMRMQFKPADKVDLPETETTREMNQITIPEHVTELQLLIPESIKPVARREQITADESSLDMIDIDLGFGVDITMPLIDDFITLAPTQISAEETDFIIANTRRTPVTPLTAQTPEQLRAAEAGLLPELPPGVELFPTTTPLRTPVTTPGGLPFTPELGAGAGGFEMEQLLPPEIEIPTIYIPEEAPRRVIRRRTALQIDEPTVIPSEEYRRLTEHPEGLLREPRRVPAITGVKRKRPQNLDELFTTPTIAGLPPQITRVFSTSVVIPKTPATFEVPTGEQETVLGVSTPVFEPIFPGGGMDLEFPPISGVVHEPEEIIGGINISPGIKETPVTGLFSPALGRDGNVSLDNLEVTPKIKRRRISRQEEGRTIEEEEDVLDENDVLFQNLARTKGNTRNTARIILALHESFKAMDQVSFQQMFQNRKKNEAATFFFELLTLKSRQYVNVQQEVSYEDIMISKTPSFESLFQPQTQVPRTPINA